MYAARFAVDLDRPRRHVAFVIVANRGHGHHWAQQHVEVGEPLGPAGAKRGPLLVGAQPREVRARHRLRDLGVETRRDGGHDQLVEQAELRGELDRRMRLFDLRARVGDPIGCTREQRDAFALDAARGIVEPRADAKVGERCAGRRGQLETPRVLPLRFRAREHTEQQVQVVSRARDRTEHVDVGIGGAAADVIEIAALGHNAEARLQSVHAARVCRHAYRTADVGAELEARESAGDRGRRATRRTARRPVERPRVVRRAEHLVVALQVARPARQVRLGEHDRAGALQPRDRGRVGRRHVIGELDRAASRADALGLDRILDRDRQSVQRAEHLAACCLFVGFRRRSARPLDVERRDRVDRPAQSSDAIEVEVEQFAARQLLRANRLRQADGRPDCYGVIHAADTTHAHDAPIGDVWSSAAASRRGRENRGN